MKYSLFISCVLNKARCKYPFTAFVLVLLFFISCSPENHILFVSTTGDDGNDGTRRSPLATFEAVKGTVNKIKASENYTGEKITVCFREGTYHIDHTWELSENDAGVGNEPIFYTAYNHENVTFSGGIELQPEDFNPVKNKQVLDRIIEGTAKEHILEIDLKSKGIVNYGKFRQHGFSTAILPAPMELFINDQPMTIARYPNEGRLPVNEVIQDCSKAYQGDFSSEPGIIGYNFDRPDYWSHAEDVWLWGYFRAGFADDNLGVASIDTAKNTIALKHAHMFGMIPTDTTDEWGGRIVGYYAYNLLEEIDMPGEYFIDRENAILYLYPPVNFESSDIALSSLEKPLIAIENTSNIHFSGITFENARGMGIYLEGSNNIQFENCTFRNLGTVAAMFGKGVSGADYPIHEFTGFLKSRTIGNLKAHVYENTGFHNNAGTDCGLVNCSIYNTGTGAVILSGGNRADLTPGNNYVNNCEMYDFNRWNKTYCAGVTLYGVENSIKNCYIHHAPHQGIAIFGNEHLIEKNHLEKLVMDVHDNGAIYIGRNPSERGNIIRHNYFSEMGQEGFKNCAIHLDDGASGTLVDGNIFYKASKFDFGDILINGGNDNIIRNNVFIDGSHVLWIEDPNMAIPEDVFNARYAIDGLIGKRLHRDIDITSQVWKEKYPDFQAYDENNTPLVVQGNEFYNNFISADEFIVSKHSLDESVFVRYENNYFAKKSVDAKIIDDEGNMAMDTIDLSKYIPDFTPIPANDIGLK
jgi:parallel beta-helix repeat protein